MTDFHTHSHYSFDGVEPCEKMVKAAIEKGITHLCLTDHLDISPKGEPNITLSNLKKYRQELTALQEKYKDKIHLVAGIEIGYTKHNLQQIMDMALPLNFEFVINSIHDVCTEDCYLKEYFANKTKVKAYGDYFEAVLESLSVPYPYHSVGHIGYVERKATYPDTAIYYKDFASVLDEILKQIIAKEKILEVNVNCFGITTPHAPNREILERYKDFGGNKITFSSDAHTTDRLGCGFKMVKEVCSKIGFKGFTVFENGKEKIIDF